MAIENLQLLVDTRVIALRDLDPCGAAVEAGELGTVFELADAYGDGGGPMVRWDSGGACNVYPGDVATAADEMADELEP